MNRIQEQLNYAARLKAAADELCVTQAQLAKALGKDQKTVCRYISGETYPAGCIAQIEEYLRSRCCIDESIDFLHIPSDNFDVLFTEIYDLLQKYGIRETELAQRIGISQKTLNNYHNHRFKTGQPLAVSTETQYRIFNAFSEYGRDLFDTENEEYNSVFVRFSAYLNGRPRAVSEAWSFLIDALDTANFFVFDHEKYELIFRYLVRMIELFNSVENYVIDSHTEDSRCIPPECIASVDFLKKFRTGEIERLLSETCDNRADAMLYNFYMDLWFSHISRAVEIYSTFSDEEKHAADALLRLVFEHKRERITYMQEYFAESRSHALDNLYEEETNALYLDPRGEALTTEETDALTELFAAADAGWRHAIMSSFNAFFGRLYIGDRSAAEIRQCLSALTADEKSGFIGSFENEILKDLWSGGLGRSAFNSEYWYNYISEYMALISFSETAGFRYETRKASDAEIRLFRQRTECLYRGGDPISAFKDGIKFSPLDWYVCMLADIALFKGMDIRATLTDDKQ